MQNYLHLLITDIKIRINNYQLLYIPNNLVEYQRQRVALLSEHKQVQQADRRDKELRYYQQPFLESICL